MLSKVSPECHPERSKNFNLSSSSAAKDLDWNFCEVEVLRVEDALSSAPQQAKPPQAGSAQVSDTPPAEVAFDCDM